MTLRNRLLALPAASFSKRAFCEFVRSIGAYLCRYAADGAILCGLRRCRHNLNMIVSPIAMDRKPTTPITDQAIFPLFKTFTFAEALIGDELFERFVVLETGVRDVGLGVVEELVD